MKDTPLPAHETKIQVFIKVILFIALFLVLLAGGAILQMFFPALKGKFMYGTLGTLGGLLTVWIFMKMEKQPFASIGLVWERKTPLRFIYGLLIGTAIFACMIVPLLGFSALTVTYNPGALKLAALIPYLALIPLALMEEIGFRSYPQVKLNKTFGLWTSQIVIAVLFGSYHILNGWSVYVSYTGPLIWAFVFGLAAIWSRGIAMPTGIHLAINILQNAAGLKGGNTSILKLDYPKDTSQAMMARTDHIGLALQIAVLIAALAATWWYSTKHNRQQPA